MPITDNIDNIKRVDKLMSAAASSVITQGLIEVQDTISTKNFAAVTYTGNGTTQDVVTGISSVDFTVSANGSGFWLDRTVNQVKNDAGVVQASGSCVVNTSKVHVKERELGNHIVCDGIRGNNYVIATNLTSIEVLTAGNPIELKSNGFSVGTYVDTNENTKTYIAYQTLYTHIKWGVTSQGKFQIEAYNPVTKEGMIYYLGSGLAGHEISHSHGVQLDFFTIKNLNEATSWVTQGVNIGNPSSGDYFDLNSSNALSNLAVFSTDFTNNHITVSTQTSYNNLDVPNIMYYKCKSETFTIGTYTGTGLAGNFVETLDSYGVARKPARIIYKVISSTGHWAVFDNKRSGTRGIFLDTSGIELDFFAQFSISATGFTPSRTVASDDYDNNAPANQYLYLVEFDTNGDGGDSYFPLPTDDTNLNITASVANYTDGKDTNGFIRSTETVTASVDLAGVSDGFKWVAKVEGGSYNFYDKKPSVGLYDKESADDNRLVFIDGKYYTTTGGELVTNGTFDTDVSGWISGGGTLTWDSGQAKLTRSGSQDPSLETTISVNAGEEIFINAITTFNTTASGATAIRVDDESSNTVYSSGFTSGSFGIAYHSTTIIAETTGLYELHLIMGSSVDGEYSLWDNISVYKKEATLGTALTTPISLIPNPVMVQSETPQYIDYSRSLSENVMEDLEVAGDIVLDGTDIREGLIGHNQTWQDVTASRALEVTYTNDTGKPIMIAFQGGVAVIDVDWEISIDGLGVQRTQIQAGGVLVSGWISIIVPSGSEYKISGTTGVSFSWKELR